jgi:hypothetical protein
MKKLFFALTLSLVGLFFSNFIIPSSEDVEKTEIVNSMLPYQTISITNNNEEQPAQVTIINGYNGSGGTTNFTLGLGQSWQGSFTGNVLSVTIFTIQFPSTSDVSVYTSYKAYASPSDIRPICSEVYTFGGNGSKDFTCLTDNNN